MLCAQPLILSADRSDDGFLCKQIYMHSHSSLASVGSPKHVLVTWFFFYFAELGSMLLLCNLFRSSSPRRQSPAQRRYSPPIQRRYSPSPPPKRRTSSPLPQQSSKRKVSQSPPPSKHRVSHSPPPKHKGSPGGKRRSPSVPSKHRKVSSPSRSGREARSPLQPKRLSPSPRPRAARSSESPPAHRRGPSSSPPRRQQSPSPSTRPIRRVSRTPEPKKLKK